MKKCIGFFAILAVLAVTGCGTNTGQDSLSSQSAEAVHPVQTKEKADLEMIQQQALYTLKMKQDSRTYDLYLFASDAEKRVNQDDSACAKAGDEIVSGDFSLAAVPADNQKEIKLLSIGTHTFQVPGDGVDVIKGDPDLLIVSHCEASDQYSAGLFMLSPEGRPVQLRDEAGKKLIMNARPGRLKAYGQNAYQSAVFSNAQDMNWTFYNWELDPKRSVLKLKKKIIPANPAELDVTEWAQNPDYFVK